MAEGKGTTQNFKDAAKWYQRSAAKGFVQAQYRLGTLDERGLGLKADQARNTFGLDGTGVTVGVLSDSYNVRGPADLPPSVRRAHAS